MRILHLIGNTDPNSSSIALALDQAHWIEPVVMTFEGSNAAIAAANSGIPTLFLRPGQSPARLAQALEVVTPDLVHLHGALSSDAAAPMRIFSNRPVVLHVRADDTDASGRLHRRVRGIRFDWRGGHHVAVICPASLGPIPRSDLPVGVSDIMPVRETDITAQWCTNLYRRLLLADIGRVSDLAAAGLA